MRNLVLTLLFIPCLGLIGCASTPKQTAAGTWNVQKYVSEDDQLIALVNVSDTNALIDAKETFHLRTLEAQKLPIEERARCLADIGITAFFNGCYDEATSALDEAISIMGGITSDPELVARVISLEGSEQERVFKGEAHERALVFLIRGLIFLSKGDFGNARACFKSGQIQDSRIVDGKAVWGDWLSLRYLEALTEFWQDGIVPHSGTWATPEGLSVGWPQEGHDSLLLVACGLPPQKVLLHNKNEYRLSYLPSETLSLRILLSPSGVSSPALVLDRPAENIFVQAVSHGRREMDKVLEAKRGFSESALVKADVAEGVGVVASQFGVFGLPVVLAAATFSTSERNVAAAMKKAPDLRQLSCIPACIYLGTFKSSSPIYIAIQRQNGSGVYSRMIKMPEPQANRPQIVTSRLFR